MPKPLPISEVKTSLSTLVTDIEEPEKDVRCETSE